MKWRDTGFAQANRPSSRESARDAAAHVANRPTRRVARGPAAAWAQFDGARESASRDFFDRTEPSPRARAQELIKKLRVASGAPITDCKKAISEVGDDLDAAFEWLRKKGAARASEKSGRATQHVRLRKPRQWRARSLAESHTFFRAQGLVGALVAENGTHAVLVEVNSETLVARNEHFQRFAADVAASASARVEGGADGPAVELRGRRARPAHVARGSRRATRSRSSSARWARAACCGARAARAPPAGAAAASVCTCTTPAGATRRAGPRRCSASGAVVALRGGGGGAAVEHAGNRSHARVAARPRYLTPEDVPDADLEREREILREQTRRPRASPSRPRSSRRSSTGSSTSSTPRHPPPAAHSRRRQPRRVQGAEDGAGGQPVARGRVRRLPLRRAARACAHAVRSSRA